MNKHKKFIREAFEGKLGLEMCQDWKNKVLEHYPGFREEEFNVWGWVYRTGSDLGGYHYKGRIFRVTEIKYGECYCEKGSGHLFESLRKATDKEVEQYLIKEAERRGFMIGQIVKSPGGLKDEIVNSCPHEYRSMNDSFYYHNMCVYKRGQWAEILTITKEQAEKKLKCKIVD